MSNKFIWDDDSDQPHIIRDKKFKNKLKRQGLPHHLKSLLVGLFVLPCVFVLSFFVRYKPKNVEPKKFFGLCVNLNKEPDLTPALVSELGVSSVLIRVPLWDMANLERYVHFCDSLGDVDIHINILQDREHATNKEPLKHNLERVFTALSPFSSTFQIGNAVNRLKWGFISVEESLVFYQVAQEIRDQSFPKLKLVGSSVIDFEPLSTVRSLFHLYPIKFDKVASLLYVDRRGAPENMQGFIFNLSSKIKLIYTALKISPKAHNKLVITETNWPLKNKGAFAPAKGKCQVDESLAAQYLVRYYLQAWQTGLVETVYWHQLIAPGYGLIDNQDQNIRKMPAFYAFKYVFTLLRNASYIKSEQKNGLNTLFFSCNGAQVCFFWSFSCSLLTVDEGLLYFDIYGNAIESKEIRLQNNTVLGIEQVFFSV